MAKTPEGEVQKYGMKELKARGCLVRKIRYEGRKGCPDLLVCVPRLIAAGRVRPPKTIFVEVKKDKYTHPDMHQQLEHARLRMVYADVRTIGSKAQVDALVKELFG